MAKKKSVMTNAMRMLNAEKIEYELIEYETDKTVPEHFGEVIAERTGIRPEQCFKTLVARSDKGNIITVCIPVNTEVNLKQLARAAGEKRAELIHVKELFALTGYVRGGVSPIGMKKKYPVFFEKSCMNFDKMAISAGVCGGTLMIRPEDAVKICGAELFENHE